MSNDTDKEVLIRPPAKGHPDDKARAAIETMVSVVPGSGTLTRVLKEMLPTQGEKARHHWEAAISERTNQNTARINELTALAHMAELKDQMTADCARDLCYLAFWNDGIRGPLEKIASAGGGRPELDQISSLLEDSESDVRTIADRLIDARDKVVATYFGAPLALALDKVVFRKIGPRAIRHKLWAFGDRDPSDPNLKDDAQGLVREINEFDEALFQVHEAIRPK